MTKLLIPLIPLALMGLALQCDNPLKPAQPGQTALTCGVKQPAQELPWLKGIVDKAEADKASRAYQGNYLGTIYLESLRDQPVFVVEMMLGSGGLAMYLFRCDGERVYPTQEEVGSVVATFQRKHVVYSNLP